MDSTKNSSQDYDRKHGKDHVAENPRSVKDIPSKEDDAKSEAQHFPVKDERKAARQEHTNHFTNRASDEK